MYTYTPKNRHPVIKAFKDIPPKSTKGSLGVAERLDLERALALSRKFSETEKTAERIQSPLNNK